MDSHGYPDSPGFKEQSTSRLAAFAVASHAKTLRQRVKQLVGSQPGLSADKIADELGESILSIRPRISELHTSREIERTGKRARNASGHAAHTWRLANEQAG